VIVPLSMQIERVDKSSDFEMPFVDSVLPTSSAPRYHVVARMLDVEKERITSYEFWSMEDPQRDDWERVGQITHTDPHLHVVALRRLRDSLDELLKDAPS
jgi:hypothetical protein